MLACRGAGLVVDPMALDRRRRLRCERIAGRLLDDPRPDAARAGRAAEAGRAVVVGADPRDDEPVVRETREPAVAKRSRRAGLAGRGQAEWQLRPGAVSGAA